MKLRQHATTLVLVGLAAAAAAVVFGVDRGSITTEEAEGRKNNLFEVFRKDEIRSIEVEASGERAKVVRGAADSAGQRPWQVEEGGARYPAEEATVDQLLGTLEFASFERRVPESSVDRGASGLDSPRVRIRVAFEEHRYDLRIGGPAPMPEGSVYAEIEGRGVVVISKQLAAALDVRASSFRARSLVPHPSAELRGISLEGEGGTRSFVRESKGPEEAAIFRWSESKARVDRKALAKVVEAIEALEAERFLSDAEADRALARKVGLSLSFTGAGSDELVFDIGGECPGHDEEVVVVQRQPSRVNACISSGVMSAFTMSKDAFLDRRLFGATIDEITELKIERKNGAPSLIEMARSASRWHLRAPEDRPLDAEAGRALVEALLAARAARVVQDADPRSLGLDAPSATLRLISVFPAASADAGALERVELVRVGEPLAEGVAVMREEDGMIGFVSEEVASSLLPSEFALRNKRIFDEEARAVRALLVQRGSRVQRFERTATGSFRLIEPKGEGLAADTDRITELAEALGGLTAERWVDKSADAHGLDKPRLIIEAEVGDELEAGGGMKSRVLKVLIGAPTSSGSFARAGDDGAIFVAPERLEQAADQWLLDRSVLRLDAEKLERVVIAGEGGEKRTLEQKAGAWVIREAAGDANASERAAQIRDALMDLVAEGVVEVGRADASRGLSKPRLTLTIEERGATAVRLSLGAGDSFQGTNVVYARRSGVDATFAIARSRVEPLFEAVAQKK